MPFLVPDSEITLTKLNWSNKNVYN